MIDEEKDLKKERKAEDEIKALILLALLFGWSRNRLETEAYYKIVEIEEEEPPNFYALRYLAEHKLSEKLGDKSASNTNEKHKEVVESFDADEDEVLEGIINAEKSKGSD